MHERKSRRMGTDMSTGEVPGMRSSAETSDKGAVCEAGLERRFCDMFRGHGSDACYQCGYLDGYRDGLENSEEIEERYGGLE